jgi:HAE1 family hydrophobic/amphiphilic exporter-1
LRLDASEKRMTEVEAFLQANVPEKERQAIIAELGVEADWSAIYSQNVGEQDSTIYLQLAKDRTMPAREWVAKLRRLFQENKKFADLQARFDADGKEPPLTIRIEGGSIDTAMAVARNVRDRLATISGTADISIVERQDAPYLSIEVDPKKAAEVGLNAPDVIVQALAALNADLWINRNFWIDMRTGNQFAVTVRYLQDPQAKLEDALNVAVTGTNQTNPVKLGSLVKLVRRLDAVEVNHVNLLPVVNVRTNVQGRGVREVAAEMEKAIKEIRVPEGMHLELEIKSE